MSFSIDVAGSGTFLEIFWYFLTEIKEFWRKPDSETKKALQMLPGFDLRALEGEFLELQKSK
ncbi:uncharacterized protein DS421_14g464100 [Arachis hypogaea]|nr:uncharacterized protein DS421_14g464100 [Arachis hypogaea]